jgi:hypothetical protein
MFAKHNDICFANHGGLLLMKLTDGLRGPVRLVLLQHPAQPQVGKLGHHAALGGRAARNQHVARVLRAAEAAAVW